VAAFVAGASGTDGVEGMANMTVVSALSQVNRGVGDVNVTLWRAVSQLDAMAAHLTADTAVLASLPMDPGRVETLRQQALSVVAPLSNAGPAVAVFATGLAPLRQAVGVVHRGLDAASGFVAAVNSSTTQVVARIVTSSATAATQLEELLSSSSLPQLQAAVDLADSLLAQDVEDSALALSACVLQFAAPVGRLLATVEAFRRRVADAKQSLLLSMRGRSKSPRTPLATCKHPAQPEVPPCLASEPRAPRFVTDVQFPLSFFKLYILTQNGATAFVAPGAFDAFTIRGTVPVPEHPGGALLALYTPFGPLLPKDHQDVGSMLVMLSPRGSVLRQMELQAAGAQVPGTATALAIVGVNVLVSLASSSGAKLLVYSLRDIEALGASGGASIRIDAVEVRQRWGAPIASMSTASVTGGCALFTATSWAEGRPLLSRYSHFCGSIAALGPLPDQSYSLLNHEDVVGVAVFEDESTRLGPYIALLKCRPVSMLPCRVEFYLWDEAVGIDSALLETIAVPAGAVGLAYAGENMILTFNSAFDEYAGAYAALGRVDVDDRVMVFGIPIIQSVRPRVRRNIIGYEILGGYYRFGPRCLLMLDPETFRGDSNCKPLASDSYKAPSEGTGVRDATRSEFANNRRALGAGARAGAQARGLVPRRSLAEDSCVTSSIPLGTPIKQILVDVTYGPFIVGACP
jgi:hypothetical protein